MVGYVVNRHDMTRRDAMTSPQLLTLLLLLSSLPCIARFPTWLPRHICMSQSQYHVFLPPTTPSPLDAPDIPRLSFVQLPHHAPGGSSQQSLPAAPDDHDHKRAIDLDNDDTSRASHVKRSRGPLKVSQTSVDVTAHDDHSRRRSTRLGRRVSGESSPVPPLPPPLCRCFEE